MKAIKDRVDSQAKNGHFEDDPFGVITVPKARNMGDVFITTDTNWNIYGSCPSDPYFTSLTIQNNATLTIQGCSIYVSGNLNIASGSLVARGINSGLKTNLYVTGSITLTGTGTNPAVLKTSNTNIFIDGTIWLWAKAKWEAARDAGYTGSTVVQPRDATYWSGIAVWGNYWGNPEVLNASLWLKNTTLKKAVYAINVSAWDSVNNYWRPTYADIYLNNVTFENNIAGITYHNARDSSLESSTSHGVYYLYFNNPDTDWFQSVYTQLQWSAYNNQPYYRPWWAYGAEDTQSSIRQSTFQYVYDNGNSSNIDWGLPPIFKRRYADKTYISNCRIYHRSTGIANHILLEELGAQTQISSSKFIDATASVGTDVRTHNIHISLKNYPNAYLTDAIKLYNNDFGGLRPDIVPPNPDYRYRGSSGIYIILDAQETNLSGFQVNVDSNYIYNSNIPSATNNHELIYIYGKPVMNGQWMEAEVKNNVLYNNYNDSVGGIAVYEGNNVKIYNNILSSYSQTPVTGRYFYGVQVADDLIPWIYSNVFNGVLYDKNDGLINAWIIFAAGSGDYTIPKVWSNNDINALNQTGTYSINYRASYFCPASDITIGRNSSGTCANNSMQSAYSEECSTSFNILECQ